MDEYKYIYAFYQGDLAGDNTISNNISASRTTLLPSFAIYQLLAMYIYL